MAEQRPAEPASRAAPRGGAVLGLLAGLVVFNALLFPSIARRITELSAGRRFTPLDLRPWYSPDEAYATIASLTPDARRFYTIVELSIDIVYPIVYSLFFYFLAQWLLAKSAGHPAWIERAAVVPFAAAIADWLENAGIATLILRYPQRADSIAWLSSGITTTKWVCFLLTFALLLYAAGRAVIKRRGRASALP